jgi:hypothetical protein
MKEKKEEFIVVFKKNVAEEHSLEVIQSFGIAFRPGMDSRRGKSISMRPEQNTYSPSKAVIRK